MTPTDLPRDELLESPPVNGHGRVMDTVRGRMRGSWSLRVLGVAVVIAAAAWAYYTNVTTAKPAMDMNMRISAGATAFPVTLAAVERGTVSGAVTYSGNVVPFNEEDVYPRVTGRLIDIPVYPGDAVRAGQVVARLDDVELTSRVHEADAMAITAQANRAQMEADVLAARHGIAQMERELRMVEAEASYTAGVLQRSERLVTSGAIARQEYENDRAMAASAQAKREAAQSKLEQARAMEASARKKVEAADAMVSQSRAASRTAQIVRDYVTITTRSSGYVVKRLVAPGVLVQPGMPILKIAQIDRVRLQANVGEKDIASIRVGSPVTVTTAGGQTLVARVTSVFPFVDQGPRTAVVEAIVDNPARALLPGQYVTMQFTTGGRADALTVPRPAVARMAGKAKVWTVKDGRAEPRDVSLGLEGADRVEVVAGLTAGEAVVVRGQEGLYAGARVSAGATPAAKSEPDGSGQSGHAGHAEEPPAPTATPHGGGHVGH